MNISRLSILSLTLAIAVSSLGYNPSFADKPTCNGQHCDHGDDGSGGDKAVAKFNVLLTGAVSGGSNPDWLRGSSRLVGESDPFNDAGSLDLELFLALDFDHAKKNNASAPLFPF